jgi:hypothetical protein
MTRRAGRRLPCEVLLSKGYAAYGKSSAAYRPSTLSSSTILFMSGNRARRYRNNERSDSRLRVHSLLQASLTMPAKD